MLVVFKSRAYGNITMFGDVATKLLELMGRSGKVPGAILPEDIPGALERLKTALSDEDSEAEIAEAGQDDDTGFIDEPVSLAKRALPLIELLEAAVAEDVPAMWERLSSSIS